MDCMSYFFNPVTIYDAHASVKLQVKMASGQSVAERKQNLRISYTSVKSI